MSCVLFHQPHPLDAIWENAYSKEEEARQTWEEASAKGDEDVLIDLERLIDAQRSIIALPARNIDDCIMKLMASGVVEGATLIDCDPRAIMREFAMVVQAAMDRGKKFDLVSKDASHG